MTRQYPKLFFVTLILCKVGNLSEHVKACRQVDALNLLDAADSVDAQPTGHKVALDIVLHQISKLCSFLRACGGTSRMRDFESALQLFI